MGGSRQAGPVRPVYERDWVMDTLKGTGRFDGAPCNHGPSLFAILSSMSLSILHRGERTYEALLERFDCR
jgi:hypothetical protein